MASDMKEVVKDIIKNIPESYVDIIRRFIPGSVVIILFYIITGIPEIIEISTLVIFLILSYAIGILIDSFTDFLLSSVSIKIGWCGFGNDIKEINAIASVFHINATEVKRNRIKCKQWKIPELIRTELIIKEPYAASILPKLIAEEMLLKNLLIGIFIIFIIYILTFFKLIIFKNAPQMIYDNIFFLILFIILEIFIIIASIHRIRRTILRTRKFFYILHIDMFKEN